MALISIIEIINIIIAIVVVGYIFTGLFPLRGSKKDILDSYTKGFDWSEFWFVCLVAAPGIILHEMTHKFVAMSFGLQAIFQVNPLGLIIGVALKLLGTGFILLAPGYVMISGTNAIQGMLTAVSGPLMNLLLWLTSIIILKKASHLSRRSAIFWSLNKEMNKWLFIFNMLPIPPLDGFKFWFTLFNLLF